MKTIANILKLILPQFIVDLLVNMMNTKQYNDWQKKGCPVPPPHIVKQRTIKEYQAKFGYDTLVETGTYYGAMVEAQKKTFKQVISIELADELYKLAVERFKKDTNVTLLHGDSGKMLASLVKDLKSPAIFWLDGHYSGGITAKGDTECPIFEELNSIFNNSQLAHIFLIDDARCFNGEGDYPTIESLTSFVKGKNEKYQVEVKHDIIRFSI